MERDAMLRRYIRFLPILLALTVLTQLTVYAKKAADTQAPTAPANLTAASVGETSVALRWSAATDNKKISAYLVYRNSAYIATAFGTSYTASGLTAATAYSFYVKARDSSGNLSEASPVLTGTTAGSSSGTPAAQTGYQVIGYYASWSAYGGYTPSDIPASSLTCVHYAFAEIGGDLKISMGDPAVDPSNYQKLSALKQSYPELKTLISVGGWNDSGNFSDAAYTDASRTAFADSVVSFLTQYNFDGVDLDWEYPVSGGLATNVCRSADKTNFTLLLAKLREKLDAQEAKDGKHYLLTIAGGAGTSYAANTELNLIANYVDYAVVMTYDIHGTWDAYTDLNAPLYSPAEPSPQYKWSADQGVKTWTAAGFPASKLVLGVPFYGYLYSGVNSGGTGLYQTFSGGTSISYDQILKSYLTNSGYTKYVHADAKVPWLFNGSTFISYDDETSMSAKAAYVKKAGLAGASIWELSQNKGGQLLNALVNGLS
jgi:chitinase